MKRAGTFKSLDTRPVAASGYTIIELMVAVAVIGVLASISIFSFTKNRGRSACYGSIRELGILLSEARMQAQSIERYSSSTWYWTSGDGRSCHSRPERSPARSSFSKRRRERMRASRSLTSSA